MVHDFEDGGSSTPSQAEGSANSGMEQARDIRVVTLDQSILGENDRVGSYLEAKGIHCVNLLRSAALLMSIGGWGTRTRATSGRAFTVRRTGSCEWLALYTP